MGALAGAWWAVGEGRARSRLGHEGERPPTLPGVAAPPRVLTCFPFHPLLSQKGAAWGGGSPRAPVGDQALQPGKGWVASGLFYPCPAPQNGAHSFPPALGAPGPGKKTEAPRWRSGLGRPRVSGRGGSWPSVAGPWSRGGPGGSLLCPSADWQQIGFPYRATHSSHHSATPLWSSFTSPVKARGTSNLWVRQSLYC